MFLEDYNWSIKRGHYKAQPVLWNSWEQLPSGLNSTFIIRYCGIVRVKVRWGKVLLYDSQGKLILTKKYRGENYYYSAQKAVFKWMKEAKMLPEWSPNVLG